MTKSVQDIRAQDQTLPPQEQEHQPGRQKLMTPQPETMPEKSRSEGRVSGKVMLITGGDSGIGRAVAVAFARECADIAIAYLEENDDAHETKQLVEAEGRECLLLRGDVGAETFCKHAIEGVIEKYKRLDVLINNAAMQFPKDSIEEIDEEQLIQTFRVNIFSMFHLVKAALPHLKKHEGSSIINTASVTAYRGSPHLLDYSATKGAIVAFTRSLSLNLAVDGVRVNAVAPGPIWTPLIPATFDEDKVKSFGSDVPMKRPGQPDECAGAFVYLASSEASYVTGQVIHVNGGEIING